MEGKQIVFNKKCAGWLLMQGCSLDSVSKSTRADILNKTIYVFNKNEYLMKMLEEYKTSSNKK